MNTGGQCTAKNFIELKPRVFSPANLSTSTACENICEIVLANSQILQYVDFTNLCITPPMQTLLIHFKIFSLAN